MQARTGRKGSGARAAGRALGAGLAAIALLAGGDAAAQSKEELDKARAAFQEGMALSAANNCAAALVKYRQVAQVKMTPQVAFSIAECEERMGRLVSALGNYRLAVSMAGDDKRAKEVAARASERIGALEERIPKLTVKRGKNAATATIELDGSELGPGQISTEMPVEPGAHAIVARMGDKELLRGTVTLAEGENKSFEVNLELPKTAPPPSTTPTKNEIPDFQQEKAPPPPPPPSKVPGIVALSVGGAAVIVGGVFMGLRGGAISDLDAACGGDTSCPKSAEPIADKGRLYTGVAEVGFIAGAVGIGTGIFLLVRASSAPKPAAPPPQTGRAPATKPHVELVGSAPGASIGGLSLSGTF